MKHPRILQEGSSSCRCSTTSHGDQKTTRQNASQNAQLVSLFARRFGAVQWSFLGPGSEKKWYSISEDSPQGGWDNMAEKMMVTLAESGHSLPSHESIVQRPAQERRRWIIVDPLLCQPGHNYNCFSYTYFCKSAQSLRSSRRNV